MTSRVAWISVGLIVLLALGIWLSGVKPVFRPAPPSLPFSENEFLEKLDRLAREEGTTACQHLLDYLGRSETVDKENASEVVSQYTSRHQSSEPLRAGELSAYVLSKKPLDLFSDKLIDHACKKLGGSRTDTKFRQFKSEDLSYFEDLLFVVARTGKLKREEVILDGVGIAVEVKNHTFTTTTKSTIIIGRVPRDLLNSQCQSLPANVKHITFTSDELIQFLKEFSDG